MESSELEYAGFWLRLGATILDTLLLLIVTLPVLVAIYGWSYFDVGKTGLIAGTADFLISWALPALATVGFWSVKQATPGKMVVSARIVDAVTGQSASTRQLIGRYLGYFVSLLPLCLGMLWIAFDRKKQGWHDKLAGTVVVRDSRRGPDKASFQRPSARS